MASRSASCDRYQWHKSFRDGVKNMYRTNYHDFMNLDPVALQNDFPSGYGGNKTAIRHEVLHRNTAFEDTYGHTRDKSKVAPGRFHFPDFTVSKQGVPLYTSDPKIPNAQFEYCTALGGFLTSEDQISTFKKAPWGINQGALPKLNFESEFTRPSRKSS
jgi:hypothetical protein